MLWLWLAKRGVLASMMNDFLSLRMILLALVSRAHLDSDEV